MIKYDTFVCNTCNRAQDVIINPNGISAFSRCTITNDCAGIMSAVSKLFVSDDQYHGNISANRWVKQPLIYDHVQSATRRVWTINHNLGASIIVHVRVHDVYGNLVPKHEFETTISDEKQTVIALDSNYTGVALCTARQATSTPKTSEVASVSVLPLSINNVMVIASRIPNAQFIELSVQPNPLRPSDLVRLPITSVPAATSPWAGASYVIISNQRYSISYVDISDVLLLHRAASTFFINRFSDRPVTSGDAYVLLTDIPYQHTTDRNLSKAVDLFDLAINSQANTVLRQDAIACTSAAVSAIYPIMKVA